LNEKTQGSQSAALDSVVLALCTQELPSVAVAIRSYLAPAGLSFTEEVAIAKPVSRKRKNPCWSLCALMDQALIAFVSSSWLLRQ
jgi:hypothetical protein